MTKNKKMMISALPFVALVVLLAVFCGIVSSKGYRLDMYIKIVFNEGIVLSIVATGAIFIYAPIPTPTPAKRKPNIAYVLYLVPESCAQTGFPPTNFSLLPNFV